MSFAFGIEKGKCRISLLDSLPFCIRKKIENRKMESLKLKNRENKAWHFRNKKNRWSLS